MRTPGRRAAPFSASGSVYSLTPRVLAALLALLLAPATAGAQYFGKNKVRYGDFDFRVMETPHFDIYYYPAVKAAARQAGVLAERWYEILSKRLGHELSRRQPLVLYASHSDFVQTNVIPGMLGEGTGGVTEGRRNRIVLPFGLGLGETDHVIGHELVHAFQFDLARAGNGGILAMPLWFIEGMAEYLTLGPDHPQTLMWMRDLARRDEMPGLKEIEHPKYFPYRYGHGAWRFLAQRFGEDIVPRLLKARGGTVKSRLVKVTGLDIDTLSCEWHEALRREFGGGEPASLEAVLDRRRTGARVHAGPSLSPDGQHLAFVSEKDQFSIEIFVADARTGKVRRKLVDRAADPHFDALEFLDGSGAWSPDSKQFVFPASRRGGAVLAIVEPGIGKTLRELRFEQLGQIASPAWSPDGKRLAFVGLAGGWSDLYVYDLASASLARLTRDGFGDLHPAWSPDGRSIVFATDRFSTDLDALRLGAYRLALLDVATREVRELPGTAGGRNITPQFGADANELFFVGDPDGRASVYRIRLDTNELSRVTGPNIPVSGITALSQAISYAPGARLLAYSVFSDGGYNIVTMKPRAGQPGDAVMAGSRLELPSVPLPGEKPGRSVEAESVTFGTRAYRDDLSLETLGQPYLSAGGGPFGNYLRAGRGFGFGDMLGDQQLGVAFQGGLRQHDFAARVLYLNRRSRLNWGVSVDYLPTVFGSAKREYDEDARALRSVAEYRRQSHLQLGGLAIYPFNRSQRVEFNAGIRNVTYGREVETRLIAVPSFRELQRSREGLPGGDPVHLFETGMAFVQDTAVWGPTSPILGGRSRLQVSPSFGSVSYTTVVADYRRYLMPVRPFTLAVRGRYVARLGGGGSDSRLMPLVVSLRDQVRGYSLHTLASRSCEAGQADCSLFDVLSGSRLIAGNVELRFPVPGFLSGRFNYGPLPVEGFVFADAASVRTRAGMGLDGWRQHLLRSVGAGVRTNAAGVVLELAAVRTFDRPGHGWTFAFNLMPGF